MGGACALLPAGSPPPLARAVYEDCPTKSGTSGAVGNRYRQGAIHQPGVQLPPSDLITRARPPPCWSGHWLWQHRPADSGHAPSLSGCPLQQMLYLHAYGLGLWTAPPSPPSRHDHHREATAAILMRIYDKTHDNTTSRIGLPRLEICPNLKAMSRGRRPQQAAYNGEPQLAPILQRKRQRRPGRRLLPPAQELLYVTGSTYPGGRATRKKWRRCLLRA